MRYAHKLSQKRENENINILPLKTPHQKKTFQSRHTIKNHNLCNLTMRCNRLTIQVFKVATSTLVKIRTPTPRQENIPRPRILVFREISFAVPARLNREIELELEVVGDIPDPVQLIAEQPCAVKFQDNALRIALSELSLEH